jgi:hypothetical protein
MARFHWQPSRPGERPAGIHGKNTKVWPFCLSAAGVGLHLYDKLHGTKTHSVVENWFEFFRHNYMGLSADGKLEWLTFYYDPVVNYKFNQPTQNLGTVFYMLPQNPEPAGLSLQSSRRGQPLGRSECAGAGPLWPRSGAFKEFRDETSFKKLSVAAEQQFEPQVLRRGFRELWLVVQVGREIPAGPAERVDDGFASRARRGLEWRSETLTRANFMRRRSSVLTFPPWASIRHGTTRQRAP